MFGDEFKKRMTKIAECIGIDAIRKCQENAMIDTIQVAVENTPPNIMVGQKSGMATGEMANRWQEDSRAKPDENLTSYLTNTMPYATFVNNGHYMDKHFVPHLFKMGGKLFYDEDADGGIMVGTKTHYVQGYYMVDKAKKQFEKSIKIQIDRLWEKVNRG